MNSVYGLSTKRSIEVLYGYEDKIVIPSVVIKWLRHSLVGLLPFTYAILSAIRKVS